MHVIYKNIEPDATRLLLHAFCLLLVPTIPAFLTISSLSGSPLLAYISSFALFHIFLIASIVLYRLSPWHPLARYPGPLVARVSMLWTAYKIWTGKMYIYRKEPHDKYGPYVRTGESRASLSVRREADGFWRQGQTRSRSAMSR